jgi:hypothetical protein
VKKGPSKKYFDFDLQTGEKTVVRAICFAPRKRKCIEDAMEKSSPIKMKKFMHDEKNEGSTDILMSDNVEIDQIQPADVTFPKTDLVPADLNLSMLSMITVNQLVTLKAKVVNLQKSQNVCIGGKTLKKVDGVLIDPYGSTKIVLWEQDIEKVKEGGTYKFKNLRLKKSKFNQELYVNPAKSDSEITECEPFQKTLAVPDEVPEEFTSATVNGEIVGVNNVQLEYYCLKCNRRVKSQRIVKCDNENCKLVQKLEKCKTQWFLKAIVEHDGVTVNVTFRQDTIEKALVMVDPTKDTGKLTPEEISTNMLSLPECQITYLKQTMLVTDISDIFY